MWWADWAMGLLAGWLVSRSRVFSIFSILLLVPFLPIDWHWELIIGLSSSFIAFSLGTVFLFRSLEGLLGLGAGFAGLLLIPFLIPFLDSFSLLIFPLTLGGVLLLLVFSSERFSLFIGLVACLSLGFLVLQRWVVPVGLPALLMGLSSFSVLVSCDEKVEFGFFSSLRDAFLGVFTGFLPGFGPGLVGLFKEGSFSPSLSISNLVFSIGLVALLGNVRSAPAAALAGVALPSWIVLFFWLVVSVLIVSWLNSLFIFETTFTFPFVGVLAHVLLLVWVGGWTTLGAALLGVCVARLLSFLRVSPAIGMVVILPSLWIFYT